MDTKKLHAQNEQSNLIKSEATSKLDNTAPKFKSLYKLVSSDSTIIMRLNDWKNQAAYSILCNKEAQFHSALKNEAFSIGQYIVDWYGYKISHYDEYFSDKNLRYLGDLFVKYGITYIDTLRRDYRNIIDDVNGITWVDKFDKINEEKKNALRAKHYLNDDDFKKFTQFCLGALQNEKRLPRELNDVGDNYLNPLSRAIGDFTFRYYYTKNCNINSDPVFIEHKISFEKEMVSSPARAMEFCVQYYLQCLQNKGIDEAWIFVGRLINSRDISK